MAALITRLRRLVGDPAGASQHFADDALQDWLDAHKRIVRYAALRPEPTPRPNSGLLDYLDYYSTLGDWEDGAQLVDQAWVPLTPASSDPLVGHWTFSVSTLPPVLITGAVYDLYGAAADACEAWATELARAYDVQSDQQLLRRSQMRQGLLAQAAEYRAKAWAECIPLSRPDVPADFWGEGLPDWRSVAIDW